MERRTVGIFLFDDVEVLDFAGPYEVFSRTRLEPGVASRRTDDTAPFEVFAVVQAIGGTLFPVLMSETYNYQFELLDGGSAAAVALIILAISIAFTVLILRLLRVPKGATI